MIDLPYGSGPDLSAPVSPVSPNLEETRRLWDKEAITFDQEPDHGLRDPDVRTGWTNLLVEWLPVAPSSVMDAGCGTGSLSVLMASLDHKVSGVDISPAMLAQAQAKADTAGYNIDFHLMDAANPDLTLGRFDVIICRHLLWALPAPTQVLRRWAELLKPGGRLLLIEGHWHTGVGLHSEDLLAALPSDLTNACLVNLSDRADLWGRVITDERYLLSVRVASS